MRSRPIEESQIASLLLGIESRGRHATGIVLINEGDPEPKILKAAQASSRFLTTKDYSEFIKSYLSRRTQIVLGHTRHWTTGPPTNNNNNHPLYAGKSAIVHNGIISNDDELFEKLGLERKAETDSDIIRAIVDEHGLTKKGVRELGKISGSIACAIVDNRTPGVLLLRSSNPLELGVARDYLFWASEKRAIAVATKTWQKLHGIITRRKTFDVDYQRVPADSAWFIDPAEGLKWHQEFKTSPYTGNYSSYRDYRYSGSWWDDEGSLEDINKRIYGVMERKVICNKCHKTYSIAKGHETTPMSRLQCPECKVSLADGTELFSRIDRKDY